MARYSKKMKLLINTPSLKFLGGGVANHYIGLRTFWTENVKYNVVGRRGGKAEAVSIGCLGIFLNLYFVC